MNSKIDFINEKTNSALLKMFVPIMLAMALTMLYCMVDSLWVGNLMGEAGMSALTSCTAIVLIFNAVSMGMGNGVSVMISHMVGARNRKEIPGVIGTILTSSVVISLIGCIFVEVCAMPLLNLLGTPEEIISDSATYLSIYIIGNVALFLYMQFTSIFRAFGDPLLQMKGMLMTVLFDAIADPFMIKWRGLGGAAIATVLSEILCLIYALIYYKKKKYFVIDLKAMKWSYFTDMMKLCIPTTVQNIMPAVSSGVMISFITSFGIKAVAGFGVARNLEQIMFMPTMAMGMTITSIVGQCYGAGRNDRAKAYLKSSMFIGGLLIALLSSLVIIFSGDLTGMFGQGDDVKQIVSDFFKIISVGYVFYMLTSCCQGYITGIGKPGKAMFLLIMYYIVIRIPAAIILKRFIGMNGIWAAFLISHILALLVAIVLLRITTRLSCMRQGD